MPNFIETERITIELDSLKERVRVLEGKINGEAKEAEEKPKEEDEIFLLSVEEYEKYKDAIPKVDIWWWLRSLGDDSLSVAVVFSGGSVYSYGSTISSSIVAVRPALKIRNLDSQNLVIGETVRVVGFLAQYIGRNSVLLCNSIDERRFDAKSNDYKTSEIKRFIEAWLKEGLRR